MPGVGGLVPGVGGLAPGVGGLAPGVGAVPGEAGCGGMSAGLGTGLVQSGLEEHPGGLHQLEAICLWVTKMKEMSFTLHY